MSVNHCISALDCQRETTLKSNLAFHQYQFIEHFTPTERARSSEHVFALLPIGPNRHIVVTNIVITNILISSSFNNNRAVLIDGSI